jgi:methyl-accepting chemotaxis protein
VVAGEVKDLAQETARATDDIGSGEIAEGIHGVATSAQVTADGVTESRRTAENLQVMSRELEEIVGQFQVTR